MAEFKIVEYNSTHAAAVADMWNRSGDSWGGYNMEITAESVRLEEETSTHVNLYLAVVMEEVVGYCKIGKWTENEGALYIESLNVRPDWHEKKIGKALVLRAVGRTMELGWPRLDLDTWAGNTKAVPLYKKAGFFWEERDEQVYLVNFLPELLGNPLVCDFFQEADWYADSTRPIRVEPDGREHNGFVYFAYAWQKASRHLAVEYARRGRGLRMIDRDEFSVTATVEKLELVFGRRYGVRYEFVNRTGKPLPVVVKGRNDKNVRFEYAQAAVVDKELTLQAEFWVDAIDAEQSPWKTHPRVSADITIGDKEALFQVGIVPKFPADLELSRMPGADRAGTVSRAYLTVRNNLSEPADFSIGMPDSPGIHFLESNTVISLEAGKTGSLTIPYILSEPCVYAKHADIEARASGEGSLRFKRELGCLFCLPSGTCHGEMAVGRNERAYVIGCGVYSLRLFHVRDAHLNGVVVRNEHTSQPEGVFLPPKLGKPFSDEFIKTKPASVQFETSGPMVTLKATYFSLDFAGIKVEMHVQISLDGIVRRWFCVTNETAGEPAAGEPTKELFFHEGFNVDMTNAVLPYKGRIVGTRTETPIQPWSWDWTKVDENWLFARHPKGTCALIWSPGTEVRGDEWMLSTTWKVGRLGPGETYRTKPVTVAMNFFETWRQCRDFAAATGRERAVLPVSIVESLEIRVNDGNPFVAGAYAVRVEEHKQKNLRGAVSVSSMLGLFPPAFRQCDESQPAKMVELLVEPDWTRGTGAVCTEVDTISIRAELEALHLTRKRTVFYKQGGSVVTSESSRNGYTVATAGNGVLDIKAAPGFAPGLFSCRHLGREWLHSSFPVAGPKDWWNPWVGGIAFHPSGVEARPLLKETSDVEAVLRQDNYGNFWRGLAVRTVFSKHDDYHGLEYRQFFMLLPGVPVLLNQVEILQNTGEYYSRKRFATEIFIRAAERNADTFVGFLNSRGQRADVVSGSEELWLRTRSNLCFRPRDGEGALCVFADSERAEVGIMANKATTGAWLTDRVTCETGGRWISLARFLIFGHDSLDDERLQGLKALTLG